MSAVDAWNTATSPEATSQPRFTPLDWVLMLVAVAVAAVLRLQAIDSFNLTFDESTLVQLSKGIFTHGYPFMQVGTMEVPLATYELVPYPIALSMGLFGVSDFSVRLPALLFGLGTTALCYYAASRWFGRRAGLLAGLLYALSPWAIYWGTNCFHPAQASFFGLLTLINGCTLLCEERPPVRSAYYAAISFALAYLSWEGIAFLLPVVFGTGLLINWNRFRWLGNKHLWFAIGGLLVVVAAQLIRRTMLQIDYLLVGSGKSEVSTPKLVFTHFDYDPWFYFKNFFLIESNLVLTIVFALGLFFVRGNIRLRYVLAVVLWGLFFMTNFLPFTSEHYVFWLLPMFLIGAAASTVVLADAAAGTRLSLFTGRIAAAAILALIVVVDLASAGPFGFKFYGMAAWEDPERQDLRMGLSNSDYHGLIQTLEARFQPGDVVVTMASLPMSMYANTKGDYFLQAVTWQKVVYDPGQAGSRYIDKFMGTPVLRDVGELQDLLANHHRVWLLAAPYGIFTELQNRDMLNYINGALTVVAQSYDGYLYLYEH
jgi:4-amino-4-deoxy-L-arabinose transferase-like glycosyltransferase